jgi:hypothetical protein
VTPTQTTAAVLMIRPRSFGYNAETAATNAFLAPDAAARVGDIERRAEDEFDAFVDRLANAGVEVVVDHDTALPRTPDAVFPNNWISFHDSGHVVLYPMLAPSRRDEVRPDVVAHVERALGVRWPDVVDLTHLAQQGAFLEGTGSLVLDRPERLALACRSPRTTDDALAAFAQRMDHHILAFDAADPRGAPVYHTNVMMAIGETFAVACTECVPDPDQRRRLELALTRGGRELIHISIAQRDRFAGNVLALASASGDPLVALSRRALDSLDRDQRAALHRHGITVAPDLTTIEDVAGGSARCMLAEVFPRSGEPTGRRRSAPNPIITRPETPRPPKFGPPLVFGRVPADRP